MFVFGSSRVAPPPPPPPLLLSMTLESKLIASCVVVASCLALFSVTRSWILSASLTSTSAAAEGSAPSARPPVTYIPVAVLLLVLFCSPGSTDTLRLLLWSPSQAVVLPPGAIFLVVGSALVLAVSFTSTIYRSQRSEVYEQELDAQMNTTATAATSPLPDPAAVAALIRTRRSIFPKDYTGAPVPRAAIERALEAANWAPTHGKTEAWRFVVFYGPAALASLHLLKREATERTMVDQPEALAAALTKMDKKAKDTAKCSAIIALVIKRCKSSSGKLMPLWEEQCSLACAVQNLHLQLTSEGYHGYWSTGGCGGWADDHAVRAAVGADGAVDGERDQVAGWFHVGVCAAPGAYKARRTNIANKTKWLTN